MKKIIILVVIGAIHLLLGLPARANDACPNPNSILNATYGWEVEEGLIDGSSAPTIDSFFPFGTAGRLIFDGGGNVSGAHDTNFAGKFLHFTDTGTYTVNSECAKGTISIPHEGLTLTIEIGNTRREVKFSSATPGRVFSGTMRLVPEECSAATLLGSSYSYATNGLLPAASSTAGFPRRLAGFVPFSNTGLTTFNGDGSVSGAHDANLDGVFTADIKDSGTYVVNLDCTGTVTFSTGSNSWHFVIEEEGDQIIFLSTETGIIWSGALIKRAEKFLDSDGGEPGSQSKVCTGPNLAAKTRFTLKIRV